MENIPNILLLLFFQNIYWYSHKSGLLTYALAPRLFSKQTKQQHHHNHSDSLKYVGWIIPRCSKNFLDSHFKKISNLKILKFLSLFLNPSLCLQLPFPLTLLQLFLPLCSFLKHFLLIKLKCHYISKAIVNCLI